MTFKQHPTQEELTRYLYSFNSDENKQANDHIAECITCQMKVEEIKNLLIQLKTQVKYSSSDIISFKHLSDQQLNDYVYGVLESSEKNHIEHHLSECFLCLKASMRLKTHFAQQSIAAERFKNIKNEAALKLENNIAHEKKSNNKQFNWQVIGYSIAASFMILTMGFFAPKYLKTTETPNVSSVMHQDNLTHVVTNTDPPTNKIIVASNRTESSGLLKTAGLQKTSNGLLNWYDGYVETIAVGTADMRKMANSIQGEIVAEKTARHIAYAQLAELLGGVQVTQHASYKEMMANADNLTIENERFIKGAEIVEKSLEWVNGSPKATITMRLPLFGEQSLCSIANKYLPPSGKKFNEESSIPLKEASLHEAYTGVLVDVRDTDYKPALFVELATDKKHPTHFAASYYSSVDELKSKNEVNIGNNPYIVKAKVSTEPGLILVDQQDSALISLLQNQDNNLAVLF